MRTQAAFVNKLYKYVTLSLSLYPFALFIPKVECWKIHPFIILSHGLRMANCSVSATLLLSPRWFFLNTLSTIIGKALFVNSIVSCLG